MESNKNYQHLVRIGFMPEQIEHLYRLRGAYADKEQITTELRRLEFARWLVSTGRLSDKLTQTRVG